MNTVAENMLADLHDSINKLAAIAAGGSAVPTGPDGSYVEAVPSFNMTIISQRGPRGGYNASSVITNSDARTLALDILAQGKRDTDADVVVHYWSREHGDCYECGDPAAFVVADLYWNQTEHPEGPTPVTDHNKMCAVCAAQHAADGMNIYRLFVEDDEGMTAEHGRLMDELGIEHHGHVCAPE